MKATPTPERAAQIRSLFDEVADLAPKEQRRRLGQVNDADLRRAVEALLDADARAAKVLRKLDHPTGEAHDPLIGQTVAHYQIEEKLGGGGMSVVYQARDTKLDRTVALKFLPPYLSTDDEAQVRFIAEARAASSLDHPNIGYIHEIGQTDDGRLFIAMAYYAGETLKKKIARGILPVGQALDYAFQMASGLERAHEAGIVHRDVKPANVMVTERGRVKIVDFGLAKVQAVSLTQTGMTLGTVAYMSPEQARGEAVDHRTDLWSLGVVLYEMLTGERPYRGENDQAIIYGIRHDEPKPVCTLRPEVQEAVSQVVEKLLQKEPDQRYGLAGEVLEDLATQAQERASTVPVRRREPASRRSRIVRYGGGALLLMVMLLVGLALFTSRPAPIDSIAVLPIKNHSGDPGQDYFADGMTDLLISNLSRLSGLDRVISRTTMMQYKGSVKSMREIGRELGVDVMVEASVLSDSAQVLITVNLIEAETERPLWGESYQRPRREMSRLPNEMALAIAQKIAVALSPQEETHLTDVAEVDPQVYELYLKGLQARVVDVPARQQKIAYFERAIALDSSFAPAYAALAIEYAQASVLSPEHEPEAEQLAEKALALDPSLSEPYIALGMLREWDWDWAGAETAFEQAIKRNPGDAFAHHELGQLWMRLGLFEEALDQERQALYLDPLSARYQSGLGEVYLYSGRYDEAIVEIKKAYQMHAQVGPYYLGHAYWQKGQYEEALRWWEGPAVMDIVIETARIRYTAVQGQQAKARAALREREAAWARGEGGPYISWSIASIYTELRDTDKALDWLERAFDERLGFLIYLKIEPGFLPLHGEPRFQALLTKMGLAS